MPSKQIQKPSKQNTHWAAASLGKKGRLPLPFHAHWEERNFAWQVYFLKMPLTSKKNWQVSNNFFLLGQLKSVTVPFYSVPSVF